MKGEVKTKFGNWYREHKGDLISLGCVWICCGCMTGLGFMFGRAVGYVDASTLLDTLIEKKILDNHTKFNGFKLLEYANSTFKK